MCACEKKTTNQLNNIYKTESYHHRSFKEEVYIKALSFVWRDSHSLRMLNTQGVIKWKYSVEYSFSNTLAQNTRLKFITVVISGPHANFINNKKNLNLLTNIPYHKYCHILPQRFNNDDLNSNYWISIGPFLRLFTSNQSDAFILFYLNEGAVLASDVIRKRYIKCKKNLSVSIEET